MTTTIDSVKPPNTQSSSEPTLHVKANSSVLRVMIADDEPSVRMFLKMVMRPLGLTVVAEARNGQEAVDLFRKEKPDLLLLDFNMPVKCGDKVLDELVHDFPDVRVIMLTSVAEAATVKRCINLGAINYLRKDMPVEQMRAALRSVFETIKA